MIRGGLLLALTTNTLFVLVSKSGIFIAMIFLLIYKAQSKA
jgi:hypothetical protein